MERHKHNLNEFKIFLFCVACVLLLQLCRTSHAQSAIGVARLFDPAIIGAQAKNMQVLPPWTIRLCAMDTPMATYDINEAKQLKIADSACWTAQQKVLLLQKINTDQEASINKLRAIGELQTQMQEIDRKRISDLLKQLNDNIAEKNECKYKPSYKWLYITVGATVAAVGLAFGVGVWVANK